ncbi:kinase-like protein [Colletotrichum zoysiae]|uniref:Kinase-like protein n=1 Tax=Colletotrichum zoysiae TaxID=1216348 RepID=A0AAD9HED2_9PEZI|nr:kinase-like protein [Colletotrichum zoysiae]
MTALRMDDQERHKASELLLRQAAAADCNNGKILAEIEVWAKRDGLLLNQRPNDNIESQQKRSLLPTRDLYAKLRQPASWSHVGCSCSLCRPDGGKNTAGKYNDDDDVMKTLITLVLCGCLFIFHEATHGRRFKSLDDFITNCEDDSAVHKRLFGRSSVPPEDCKHGIFGDDIKILKDACVHCQWKAFKSAVNLKKRVVDVYQIQETKEWEGVPDLTFKNMPFIQETTPYVQNNAGNPVLYACKVHPEYITTHQWQGKELFRKVYHYLSTEDAQCIETAKREAEIAFKMWKRRTNVAELLFAFSYKDSEYEYVELVYPRYLCNLGEIFAGSSSFKLQGNWDNQESRQASTTSLHRELVADGRWTMIMGIVQAVAELHHAIKKGRIKCLAHMDIKPANILVKQHEGSQGTQTLLLSDFGHAAKLTRQNATADYAPPPPIVGNAKPAAMTAYDVWSMGCVLLQMLVYIDGGKEKYEEFNSGRRTGQSHDAAFWQKNPQDKTAVLRQEVNNKFSDLESRTGPQTRKAIEVIREMLSIGAVDRPDMETCQLRFTRLEDPRGKELMKCNSDRWDIVYRPSEDEKTTPINIAVYRDSQSQLQKIEGSSKEEESIRLVIRYAEWGNGPSFPNTTTRATAWFIPQAFFDRNGPPGHPYPCRLKGLHEEGIFYFNSRKEYLLFMGLMTYHTVLSPKVGDVSKHEGLNFAIQDCWVKECNLGGPTHDFKGGRVQLWKLLKEEEYNKRYERQANPTWNPGTQRTIPSGYKMVIFTTRANTDEKVCVVIDIGRPSWKLLIDRNKNRSFDLQRKARMGDNYIKGCIFGPICSTPALWQPYPGVPIDPRELDSEKHEKRFKQVHIELEEEHGATDRQHIREILEGELGSKVYV